MLEIDATDYMAIDARVPDVDGFNIWPLINGDVDESPRQELIISHDVFISGEYKLNIGNDNNKYAIWQSEIFPNDTTPSQDVLESITLDCADNKYKGCLFNVRLDPGEHHNLIDTEPEKFIAMKARLDELKLGFFANDQEGTDSCPDGFNSINSENCGCWMAANNYHQFAGPYQDLTESQQNWNEKEKHGINHGKINFHSYIILVIVTCSVVICGGSLCFCYKMKQRVFMDVTQPNGETEGICPDETTPLVNNNNYGTISVPVTVQS